MSRGKHVVFLSDSDGSKQRLLDEGFAVAIRAMNSVVSKKHSRVGWSGGGVIYRKVRGKVIEERFQFKKL